MILFESDWIRKHPGAIIHYETQNKSFIRLAEIYHKLGVKNCAFHLSLLNQELKHVDPFDPDLPLVMKAKILEECQSNFWYYIREVVRIPTPGSLVPSRFRADRGNIALFWLFFNHVMTLIVILRQTGKTISLITLGSYLLNFGSTNTLINLLTKSEALKAETLSKLKQIFEELPEFLDMSTKKDIFNNDEVHLRDLSNKFKGSLSSSSPKQAEKTGRGFTSPINVIDEAAFIENLAIAMGAMLMSGNAAREYARAAGKAYGTILATTAGNTNDRDGSYVYNILETSTIWDESLYDTQNEDELNKLVITNSRATDRSVAKPIVTISLSYRQLGYDDEWLKRRLSENISTPENIARDIFNKWLSGANDSPIPKHILTILNENTIDDPRTEIYAPYNYILRWYISEETFNFRSNQGHKYSIGIDTSDAVGRDDITFVMRDHVTGEVVCTSYFNEVNLITLSSFFVDFLMKYDNTVMIIERRSSAAAIIDYLIQKLLSADINPFTRLYNTIFQEREKYKKEFDEITKAHLHKEEIFIKYKKHIGFTTSGTGTTSRSELYSATLINMLTYTAYCLYDTKLITQICALVIRNNRVDHPSGGNDDMVIASLLSYWLLVNGRNLQYYNIPTSTILKQNKVYLNEKYTTNETNLDEEEIYELETELNRLTEEYRAERNEILCRKIEIKIRMIANELKLSNYSIAVEDLINTINQEKRLNQTKRM